MADFSIKVALDRLHDINDQILTVTNARRYFPQNIEDGALHPVVVPIPPSLTQRERVSSETILETHSFSLFIVVGSFMKGIPTETTSQNAEAVIEEINDAYSPRTRLQLGDNGPDWCIRSELGVHSGLQQFGETVLAFIDWPLIIESRRVVTVL